jgi:hypothetical protein
MADRFKVVWNGSTKKWGVWDKNKGAYAFGTEQLTDGPKHKKRLQKQADDMNSEWERIKREKKGK